MKRRMSNATLLGVFLVATVGSGTQAPGLDPASIGQWGPVLSWPVRGTHTVVLKNGKVLAFGGAGLPINCLLFEPPVCVGGANDTMPCDFAQNCPGGGVCMYNVTPFFGPNDPPHGLLSSGHVALADGKIMFTGGSDVVAETTLYDPDVDPPGPASWISQDDGSGGPVFTKRFYPTCTVLGDGTVLVTAGLLSDQSANTPAIFDPTMPAGQGLQWRELSNAEFCGPDLNDPNPNCQINNFHLDVYPGPARIDRQYRRST